jgi:hypothetical protein
MKTLEIEISPLPIQLTQDYIKLLDDHETPLELKSKTIDLLKFMNTVDVENTEESLRGASLCLGVYNGMSDFYNTDEQPANFQDLLIAAALHDIGKVTLPDLVDLSHKGNYWSSDECERMKQHVLAGGRILRTAGIPERVARVTEAHHDKQGGNGAYLLGPYLTYEERRMRDAVSISDFTLAMMTRTNTRNRLLSREQRIISCRNHVELILDDYDTIAGRTISEEIIAKVIDPQIEFLAA